MRNRRPAADDRPVSADPLRGGRPALSIRLMAGLLYLKHAYALSDEAVCALQFKRMRRVLRRQRRLLGRVIRDIGRKRQTLEDTAQQQRRGWVERAERLWRQRRKDKRYAVHAPEVECIGKGKARRPYEFAVKVGMAVTAKKGRSTAWTAGCSRARKTMR
ncbi:hypothetical protein ISN36_01720 [Xanthomonas translucens pv. undulosa]|nr:hypothetical protein ISN36_01720 [Xanthomonas translucens pv. undulosa]QSQ62188.1 hypothetical protein ISN38_06525 [Xanthomonas translucens pv. undulosa]